MLLSLYFGSVGPWPTSIWLYIDVATRSEGNKLSSFTVVPATTRAPSVHLVGARGRAGWIRVGCWPKTWVIFCGISVCVVDLWFRQRSYAPRTCTSIETRAVVCPFDRTRSTPASKSLEQRYHVMWVDGRVVLSLPVFVKRFVDIVGVVSIFASSWVRFTSSLYCRS